MGPATVAAARKAAPNLHLDIHLGVAHPTKQLVDAFVEAGASSITIQWEVLYTSIYIYSIDIDIDIDIDVDR